MNYALALIALLMLGGAAAAMMLRNLIHCALCLVVGWFGLAAFYLWAGAQFAAFAQVIVYVGAVSMIVLFAVLLTRNSRTGTVDAEPVTLGRIGAAMMTTGAVGGVLFGAVLAMRFRHLAPVAPTFTVRQLGEQLIGPQAAALLVVGVILTVALLGAVVLAATEPSDKEEDGS